MTGESAPEAAADVEARRAASGATTTAPIRLSEQEGLRFYTIMFTDIVASTDLRARLGDGRADELHHEVDHISRRVVAGRGGTAVKGLGDGLLAVFPSPTEAVAASIELQHEIQQRNRRSDTPLGLRVGLTIGEVNIAAGDVFGLPVNEAARLCGAAGTDGILVSELVRTMANRISVEFGPPVEVAISPSSPLATAHPVVLPSRDTAFIPLPPSLDALRDDRFVGRRAALEQLTRQWAAARRGTAQVAVVSGEPGIGKSRLLARLAGAVGEGPGIVLYGRSDERAASPYQPFSEALAHFLEHCPTHELGGLLGESAGELARLVPALPERLDVPPPRRLPDPESERWLLHEAVADWIRSTAAFEPVLLILDDLHWATSGSLDLLWRLLQDGPNRPLMIVLALRPWEPESDPGVARVLADRHRLPLGTVDVELDGLSTGEVGELAGLWSDGSGGLGADDARELCEITAGNPLFVSQVLRNAEGGPVTPTDVPVAVVDVIGRQIEKLAPLTIDYLHFASIVGPRFEARVVDAASGLGRQDGFRCFDEAVRAGLTHTVDGPVLEGEFTHSIVRRVIEDGMDAGQRRDAHGRVAAALEELVPRVDPPLIRRLAYHLAEAGEYGDPTRGVVVGCRAAADALDDLAVDDALALLDRADRLAELTSDDERACERAVLRAEALCRGAKPGARRTQLHAADLAEQIGDPALLERAAMASVRGYFATWGEMDTERVAALEAALALSDPADGQARARLLARLANELTFGDPEGRRFTLVDEALPLARDAGEPRTIAEVLGHRQYVMGGPSHLAVRLAESREMATIAAELGDRFLEMQALRLCCDAALEDLDVPEVDRCLARLDELNGQIDLLGSRWELASIRASRAFIAGDLREMEHQLKRAFQLGQAAGQSDAFLMAGGQLIGLQYLQGRLPDAMDDVVRIGETIPALVPWVARQLYQAGRVDDAASWWARTRDIGIETQLHIEVNAGTVLAAWAFLAARFPESGLVPEMQVRLAPYENKLLRALVPDQPGHHFLGMLAASIGEHDRADAHFTAAIDLLGAVDAPLMVALSQVEWARGLASRGDRRRAETLADAAATVGRSAGALQIERDATRILEGT